MSNPNPHNANSQPPTGQAGYKRQSSVARGDHLSFSDGQSLDVQIMSASATSSLGHWVGGRRIGCTGSQCSNCMAGDKASIRWALDVMCEGKSFSWEMANLTYAQLEDVAEMVGHLYRLWVRVKRSGTGRNTRYTIIPMQQPDQEEQGSDAQAQAEYIKHALAALDLDPKNTLADFLNTAPDHIQNGSARQQLDAFQAYVESLGEPIPSDAEAEILRAPASVTDYFG